MESSSENCCSHCPNEGRNLVVSIDGTAGEFSTKNSNVVELCRILIKDETQLVYYATGIGTFAEPQDTIFGEMKQSFITALEMVTAIHFERKVFAAYQWLSENYIPGDRIFLFGFSRGAYFVRVIAAMIKKVGLLHRGNSAQIPFAFKIYARSQREYKRSHPDGNRSNSHNDELCARYKATFSHTNVIVHFVGAWDTVSSVGFGRSRPCLPETITMDHVRYFRHALALDEWRVKFLPEHGIEYNMWTEDLGQDDEGIKEVWFRGCHADVGGTNNTEGTDRPSLRWMISEAHNRGIRINPSHVPSKGHLPSTHVDPATWYWKLIEWLPIRVTLHANAVQDVTHTLHRGRSRTIWDSHRIHSSVRDTMRETAYKPKARLCVVPEDRERNTPGHAHKVIENIDQISERWVEDVELPRRAKTLSY